MKMYLIVSLVLVALFAGGWIFWPSKKYPTTCFSPENFDSVLKYVEWKDRTSKIGKVLVNGYVVKMNQNVLVFCKDKTDYTLFTISREKIQVLAVKKTDNLQRKAEESFCELLERAKFRGY